MPDGVVSYIEDETHDANLWQMKHQETNLDVHPLLHSGRTALVLLPDDGRAGTVQKLGTDIRKALSGKETEE